MSVLKEFKEFAVKGNVVDLAVGVVIGTAFGKIVSSVVGDVLMPPLGLLIGGVSFSHMNVVLKDAIGDKPAVTLNYGTFLQALFDFILVAIAVFVLVKAINKLRHSIRPPVLPPAPPSREVELLTEIRDALAKKPS
ncbi:MAG: large-conductance mechanosensitive channel protein MscL [Deltaproteobacteria bacterium]|nr:large-conductance mechanosensitive channel protein MscL [Deltaproteobacteria bacterium]